MARTIQTIYNDIITEKETFGSLSGLTAPVIPDNSQRLLIDLESKSKVSMWRLNFWVMAVTTWTVEKLFDIFKENVEDRAIEIIPGTLRWYSDILVPAFQYGDELIWNGKWQYADSTSVTAEAKKIITQSAAIETNSQLTIKIARGTVGALEPISSVQLTAFEAYIEDLKFAGTQTSIINSPAEVLFYDVTVEYDPLVLDSNGLLISDGVTFPAKAAVENYVQFLPFNSQFVVSEMIDSMQAAEGVVNPVTNIVSAITTSTNILAVSTQTYTPLSGYMTATGSTITYTPA